MPSEESDRSEIAELVRTFFAAFTSGSDVPERIEALRAILLPEAMIVRTCGSEPVVYDVDGFLAPRLELLTSGRLQDFREWETAGRTELYGDVAQHWCSYAKTWLQDGAEVTGRGLKTLQFVRTAAGWRVSAAAWDDEREGLATPDSTGVRPALDALELAYTGLAEFALSLDEAASWRPTGCAGWLVRDLLHHLLGDAQRALVALATPVDGPADTDAATYWRDWQGAQDPESRDIRATRTMASQWQLDSLAGSYAETATAVVRAAARCEPGALVATQGHVLAVDDLLSTLVVEATIHQLDLTVELDRPGPHPELLAITRSVLDRLLGRRTPTEWDGAQWLRAATGRIEPTGEQLRWLGADADRLPLLG